MADDEQNQPPNQNENQQIGDGPHQEVGAASISVRLPFPSIVRDNIELWFLQLDHWFTINRITSDSTRFRTVEAALDANLLQQIYETVRNPPAPPALKYEAVKSAVIKNFTESEQRRAQQFVSGLQLGDKKPSHLLNDLRRIGGENQDEKLLKVLWMNRLPMQVQTCLAAVTSPLNALAELADSVMETFRVGSSNDHVSVVNFDPIHNTTSTIAATSNSSATNNAVKTSDSDALSKLTAQIEKLTKQMTRLYQNQSSNGRSRSNERSSSRQRNRSTTPANRLTDEDDGRCLFHRTYGSDALKCHDPCTENTSASKN